MASSTRTYPQEADLLAFAHHAYSIVLVPGIGTTSPRHWPFATQTWLATLPSSGNRARVLAFEYSSPFEHSGCSWEGFLMLGYDLLESLTDLRSQANQGLVSGSSSGSSDKLSADTESLSLVERQQTNFAGMPQLGGGHSQTGLGRRQQAVPPIWRNCEQHRRRGVSEHPTSLWRQKDQS